ncbi:MAG TPA: stage II sporulation protein M [Vicinamibacteria bacterium]|nr:stage II sporulation protein M [Vicinamibacteria bacterium]
MNKATFLKERRPAWERFQKLLERVESRGGPKLEPDDVFAFSELFRALCYDLSQVRSRDWGSSLERFLNDLVVRGHAAFYRRSDRSRGRILRFFTHSFPSRLRENHAFLWASIALFTAPLAVSWIVVASDPSLARRVLPGSALYTMEQMYSGDLDEAGRQDAAMAGFYVRHNISIAFQCFALGVFLGVGTVYVLLSNGIQLGTVSGYIVGNGHAERFLGFVSGHSSFELSAIVVAGTAGLILGHAIVAPGSFSRGEALRRRGRVAVEIALGSAAMLFVAALIEGFWSAQPLPAPIKYVVAGVFWIAVISYLALSGRREPRE